MSELASDNNNLVATDMKNRENLRHIQSVVQREVSTIASSINVIMTAVFGGSSTGPVTIFETATTNPGWTGSQRPTAISQTPAIGKQQNFQTSTFSTALRKSSSDMAIIKVPSTVSVAKLPEACDSSTNDKALPRRTDAIPPLHEDSSSESDIADIAEQSTDDEDWNKPLKAIAEESYLSDSAGSIRSTKTGRNVNKTINASNLTIISSKDKSIESRKDTSSNKENFTSPLLQQTQSTLIQLHNPSFEQNRSNCTPLHSPSFKQNQSYCTPLQSPSFEQSITPLASPLNRLQGSSVTNTSNVSITLLPEPHNRSSDHISGIVVSRRKTGSKNSFEGTALRNRTNINVLTSPIRTKSPIRRSKTPQNEYSCIADGTLMVGACSSTPYATRRTSKRNSTRIINYTEQLTTFSETISQATGRPKRKAAPTNLVEPKMNSKLRRPREASTLNLKSRRSKSK